MHLLTLIDFNSWNVYKRALFKNLQSVPQEKVRVYSKISEENLIFLFWHKNAHKALGRTHLINRPVAIVLDNGLAPFGHPLD